MKHQLLVGLLMTICILSAYTANASEPSGSIPTMYVNTENSAPVVDKENYIGATCYINSNNTGLDDFGSSENQIAMQIRGRGNYTWWGFDKKPYKIKLDKKDSPLGLTKSKHFALLANPDDQYGYLRNHVGFELSRCLGLDWTPDVQPVELVVNGKYDGIYFLTESIKIASNRLDITEQEDNETDPETLTGGWLIEIDNYDSDPHVSITEGNGQRIIFTYKSPEVLSPAQQEYLKTQMTMLDKAIYDLSDSSKLLSLLDLESAVRFYIVQEIMDDCESYHGSCYLYKDRGNNMKWHFGPVWDFGNSFSRHNKDFIYVNPAFNQTWIGQLAKHPVFQEKVKEVWKSFITEENSSRSILRFIDEYIEYITDASVANDTRWPQYAQNDLSARKADFVKHLNNSLQWLGERWGTEYVRPYDIYLRGTFNNWSTTHPLSIVEDGIYRIKNVSFTGEFKIATEDWQTIDLGSNGNLSKTGEKYYLTDKGQNINHESTLENVVITLDLRDKSMLITQHSLSGIGDVYESPSISPFTLNVNRLTSSVKMNVYNISGFLQAEGYDIILSPGLYIVATTDSHTKILIK